MDYQMRPLAATNNPNTITTLVKKPVSTRTMRPAAIIFHTSTLTSNHAKHKYNTTSRHDQPIVQHSPPADCSSTLPMNDHATGDKLKVVAEQLELLVDYTNEGDSSSFRSSSCSSSPQPQANLNKGKCSNRLKTILMIYMKILNIGPLDYHLSDSSKSNRARNFHYPQVQYLRQQILNYIENLDGYCDSINNLHMILKSTAMISLMSAYEKIVTEIAPSSRD